MEYTNTQIRTLIDEYIHSQRDRKMLYRRLVDGATFEILSMEFVMSERQIRTIVHRNEEILFRHLA